MGTDITRRKKIPINQIFSMEVSALKGNYDKLIMSKVLVYRI